MEGAHSSTPGTQSFVNTSHNFYVLKELKSAEEQYKQLQNRIKILRLNDERNMKKIQNNQNKIEKLQKIRHEALADSTNLSQLKKGRSDNLQLIKKKNKDLRDSIVKNTQSNLEDIHLKKAINYEEAIKQSKCNHQKIQSLKLESVEERKAQYQAAVVDLQKSKQIKLEFMTKKNKSIHQEQAKQNEKLKRKREKKVAQIRDLEKVEMQMMNKYSESHIAFKNVKNKLDEMLGKIQNERSFNKVKNKQDESSNVKSISFYVCSKKTE